MIIKKYLLFGTMIFFISLLFFEVYLKHSNSIIDSYQITCGTPSEGTAGNGNSRLFYNWMRLRDPSTNSIPKDIGRKEIAFVNKLSDGLNILPGGEEIFYISNPALGLWSYKEKFKE